VTATFEQAARSWTEHLRAGGSTPWSQWVVTGADDQVTVPPGWTAPGAAQLEFVRRAAALTEHGFPAGLADLVFGRSGPARGLAHLPLGWPGTMTPRPFGPPRTDPADVPGHELVRVGVGALTELLLRSPGQEPGEWRVRRRLLTRDPSFELAGAPVTVAAVRRALAVAGHVEGGHAPRVVLLAEPFDAGLAQVWSARAQRGAPARWRGFVARTAHRQGLPPSIDLPGLAGWWAPRVGRENVHVLVAPGSGANAARLAAEVLGLSLRNRLHGRRAPDAGPRVLDLTPAAVDVVRRVNAVLAVRATEQQQARATRTLSSLLVGVHGSPRDPLTVPRPFQDWARERGAWITDELRRGGYAVHGNLDRIVPAFEGVPVHPDRDTVLRLVLTACVRLASTGERLRTKERER